jgi:hypothetical protein
MDNKTKTRMIFYIDPAQRKALDKISAKTGAPVAELIRRAIADWLERYRKAAER